MDIKLPAIAQALEMGGNPNYTVQKLQNINHMLQFSEGEDLADPFVWIENEETVNPEVLQIVLNWAKSRTQK